MTTLSMAEFIQLIRQLTKIRELILYFENQQYIIYRVLLIFMRRFLQKMPCNKQIRVLMFLMFSICFCSTQIQPSTSSSSFTSILLIETTSSSIPQHCYLVSLPYNSTVNGEVTCANGTADLEVFIFKQGADLMNLSQYTAKFVSSQVCRQQFSYTNKNLTGPTQFYIRVFPYSGSSNQTQFYSYILSTNINSRASSSSTHNNWMQKMQPLVSTLTFTLDQGQLCITDYKLIYYPPVGIETIIIIRNPIFQQMSRLQVNASNNFNSSQVTVRTVNGSSVIEWQLSNISMQGTWSIRILYNVSTRYYSLTPYSLQLYKLINQTKCQKMCQQSHSVWDNITLKCKQLAQYNFEQEQQQQAKSTTDNKKTKIGVIVGISIGVLIVVFIFFLIVCVYKRLRSPPIQHPLSEFQLHRKNTQANISQLKMQENQYKQQQIRQNQCAICLETNCNSSLKCMHVFHYKCITQWLKKKKRCPFCRKFCTIKEIIKIGD